MTRLEKIAAAGWGGLAVASWLIHLGWLSFQNLERFPLCAFRRFWGIPCPGCGMGHALLWAFQGQWRASFQSHPFGLVVWALWTAWLGQGIVNRLRRRPFGDHSFIRQIGPLTQKMALASLLLAYMCRL